MMLNLLLACRIIHHHLLADGAPNHNCATLPFPFYKDSVFAAFVAWDFEEICRRFKIVISLLQDFNRRRLS